MIITHDEIDLMVKALRSAAIWFRDTPRGQALQLPTTADLDGRAIAAFGYETKRLADGLEKLRIPKFTAPEHELILAALAIVMMHSLDEAAVKKLSLSDARFWVACLKLREKLEGQSETTH